MYLIPVLGVLLLAIVACGDVRTRRIPNALSIAVVALGLLGLALNNEPTAAIESVAAAAAVFGIGFLLFCCGLIGGGDVKMMSATVLLVGSDRLSLFLVAMGLCGLVVTLAVIASDRLARRPALPQAGPDNEPQSPRTVPYGVAIAGGGILTLLAQLPF